MYSELLDNEISINDFMKKHIDISIGPWLEDLKSIFTEDLLAQIRLAISKDEMVNLIITFLKQKNSINVYKTFFSIWKKHAPAPADLFEDKVRKIIKERGLQKVDEKFQSLSKYIILIIN